LYATFDLICCIGFYFYALLLMFFVLCYISVCVESRSRSQSPHRKSPLASVADVPTSQLVTTTSPSASSKSTDHDTASFSARTAGNYRRSKRKSVKSAFTVCPIVASHATMLLTSTRGRLFRKRTRSFIPILQFEMHISQKIMNYV